MDVIAQLKASLAGRYDLEGEIGAGGMATVYLARDVKHNRRVAIKVLKPELGSVLGSERFLAEIQVTANLQHPNLLPLFDSGEADGLLYYVMPYVDGETLRHRIHREKQLAVDDALAIAVAVASALEYAHAHGVIHRDLKPENILLQGGQPIVADFGIALAVSNAGGQRVTQSGISLGTPQYMSPEQATGDRTIDARADIFSLGAVVYEMLTGEPPHSAPTAQAIIAKLLSEEARSIAILRRAVPEHVDGAVLRALEKLPADRFTSARSFADALQGKAHIARPRSAAVPARNRRMFVAGASAGAVFLSALAGFATWRSMTSRAESVRPTRSRLAFQGEAKFASGGGIRVAFSPNGSQFAYVGVGDSVERLYIKALENLEPKPIAGTEGASHPQFSPDGKWIAFIDSRRRLRKVLLGSGNAVTIADTVDRFSWGDRDVVVFARFRPLSFDGDLLRTSAAGGPIDRLAMPDSSRDEGSYSWPFLLPGAKAALFSLRSRETDLKAWQLAAIRLADKSIVRLHIDGFNPRYLSTGHIVYTLPNGTVMAARFDVDRLEIRGDPVAVLEHVLIRGQGASQFAISQNGTLIYFTEAAATQLAMTDRTGRMRVLNADSVKTPGPVRFSPDGKRIAVTRGRVPSTNIWLYDVGSRAMTQVTSDNLSYYPEWSADGRQLAWSVLARGKPSFTQWRPWDGNAPPVTLLDSASQTQFSPSGKFVVSSQGPERWFVAMLDNLPRRRALVLDSAVGAARISPDGQWIAYQARVSDEGPLGVFVRSLSGPGGRHQISKSGGMWPVWGATSEELFYRNRGSLWSATLTLSPEFAVVRRDSLFAMSVPDGPYYDVSRDGKRFVMPWFVGGDEVPPPFYVTGWFTELRQRMAAARAP